MTTVRVVATAIAAARVVVVIAIVAAAVAEATLRVLKLRPSAVVPTRGSGGAAGLDLSADASVAIAPGAFALVGTGIIIALPPGHEGQVRPRSGLAIKHGVTVLNAPGTIDEDYRGEVLVALINHGPKTFHVAPGDRIAQLVIAKVEKVRIAEVETLDETARGEGGFGSTGR